MEKALCATDVLLPAAGAALTVGFSGASRWPLAERWHPMMNVVLTAHVSAVGLCALLSQVELQEFKAPIAALSGGAPGQ